MTIFPTHHCFDDALDLLVQFLREDPAGGLEHSRFWLVHGIARYPEGQPHAGERFAHAWVETFDKRVWDCGVLDGELITYSVDRAEFYEKLRIETTTRYSARAAWDENRRSGTYGPWQPEYQALCRHHGSPQADDAVREETA